MEKLILLLIIVFALTTASCKKSYNCVCTIIQPGAANINIATIVNDTKSRAATACYGIAKAIDGGGSVSVCSIQ